MPNALKDKVEARLKELDRNPFEAARLGELERGFVNDLLQGKKRTVKGDNLGRLAKGLDWTVADLIGEAEGVSRRPIPVTGSELDLPIRYEVAAGAWHEVDEVADEPLGHAPAPRVPGYEQFAQWYERVVGDSFDRRIPPGALIHVVDAIALEYEPRHGDVVVVERSRAGGQMLERTVKEIAIVKGAIELWPRSHNPRWSKPLIVTEGVQVDEDVTVRIAGKVLRAYIGLEGA